MAVGEVLNDVPGDFGAVRAGEVCTVETAKALGIFDAARYFRDDAALGDTRTFGDRTPDDAARQYALCAEDADGNTATPLCPLVGPGLVATGDGACAFPACPPGFADAGHGACTKPVLQSLVPRAERCDAQWHDWFTVPNAHMGNGYATVGGRCVAPCPGSSVPARGADPLTGKDRGATDEAQCVDKLEYLGGKFAGDSDFCAVAWVKRLSADAPALQRENRAAYPQYLVNGSEQVRAAADAAAADALRAAQSRLENVTADSATMQMLCRELETPERLAEAYATCRKLGDGDAREYAERLRAAFPKITDVEIQRRWRVLHQACHHAFCDTQSGGDRAFRVGKPALCFPADRIARMDMGDGYDALPDGASGQRRDRADDDAALEDALPDLVGGYQGVVDAATNGLLATLKYGLLAIGLWYVSRFIKEWYDMYLSGAMKTGRKLLQ